MIRKKNHSKVFISLNQDDLRNLQLTQLKILREIRRICEQNNIKYFLAFGSLIGAVRHNGFIPWDDDIDIGMFREEYNKFIKACKYDLGDKYFLQTIDSDSGYGNIQGRILLNDTVLVNEQAEFTKAKSGISVSIFAFDFITRNKIKQLIQSSILRILLRAYKFKKNYLYPFPNSFFKAIYFLLAGFVSFFPSSIIKCLLNNTMIKYNKKNNVSDLKVICFPATKHLNTICNFKDIDLLKSSSFEDDFFNIPVNYDKLLKKRYGNYMDLPPVKGRMPKHTMVLYKP
jgi:lipopolysaccharide cholinephosphotransferase